MDDPAKHSLNYSMRGAVHSIPAEERNSANILQEGNNRQSIFMQNTSISSSYHVKRPNVEEGVATDLKFNHSDSSEDKVNDISVDDEEIKQHTNTSDDKHVSNPYSGGFNSRGDLNTDTKTENLRRSLLKQEAHEHYFGSLLEVKGFNQLRGGSKTPLFQNSNRRSQSISDTKL